MERSLNEYDLLKVFCVLLVIIGHVLNMYDVKGMVCIAEVPSFNIAKDCIYSFHMPVFVAISGAIYAIQKRKAKYNNIFMFVKKVYKTNRPLYSDCFFYSFSYNAGCRFDR